jgi:hypothetical protein
MKNRHQRDLSDAGFYIAALLVSAAAESADSSCAKDQRWPQIRFK